MMIAPALEDDLLSYQDDNFGLAAKNGKQSNRGTSIRYSMKHDYEDRASTGGSDDSDSLVDTTKRSTPSRKPHDGNRSILDVGPPPHLDSHHDHRVLDNSPSLFPVQLYKILEAAPALGFEDIVSWLPTGDGFRVHDRHRFERDIMPRFFASQSKFKSFLRQLNLYKFKRMSNLKMDRGCYKEARFIRGKPDLCTTILRTSTSTAVKQIQEERGENVSSSPTRNTRGTTATVTCNDNDIRGVPSNARLDVLTAVGIDITTTKAVLEKLPLLSVLKLLQPTSVTREMSREIISTFSVHDRPGSPSRESTEVDC